MYKESRGPEAMRYLATRPTMIVTTRHPSGIVNAGVFGSYVNLSPTQIGLAAHRESHTHANILRQREFVVNIPGADIVRAIAVLADDVPDTESEVEKAGLTVKPGVALQTPSIAECQAAAEFVFEQEVPVGSHSFLIGHVAGGWIRRDVLDPDGRINIFKARVFKDFKYPEPLYVLPGEVIHG